MNRSIVISLLLSCSLLAGCIVAVEKEGASTGQDSAYHNTMAVAFMNEGKFQLASVELHKSLQMDPGNADALSNLGLVHMNFEEYEVAIGYFRQAVGRDGKLTEAYNNIGVCHMKLNQFKEAEAAFRQAIADPFYKSPEVAYYNLGTTLYREGKYDAAIRAYTMGMRRNPEYIAPLFGIALAHNRADRLSEAAETLQKAIELEPNLKGDQDAFAENLRKRLETATGDEERDVRDLLDILKY